MKHTKDCELGDNWKECPACLAVSMERRVEAGSSSRPAPGSEIARQKTSELREAFRRMEEEQREEYRDYVRRCGGVPISKVKP